MKIFLAVVMLLAIAGLLLYNQKLSAQSEAAAIAAKNHRPFQPVNSRQALSPPAASHFNVSQPTSSAIVVPSSSASQPAASVKVASQFTCDGRTHCSQMRSCEEATYFIQHCPNTKMDGNNDGVPCERQWCK